ncbi:MAG: hypothetical protein QM710_01650 [Flavobacterium sp.]
MRLRLLFFLLAIIFPLSNLKAQNTHEIDSLKRELKKAKDPNAKFKLYQKLVYFGEPIAKYKSSVLLNAELSKSTDLQLRTYLFLGQTAAPDSIQVYLDKMFALAKEDKNEEFQGWYYIYSGSSQYFGNKNRAKGLDMIREANAIAAENHLDSLAYEANRVLGFVHQGKGERLLEYKSYMLQLSLAEKIGDGEVAISTYAQMFWFYNRLKQYPKAKEYALKILEKGQQKNWPVWIEGGYHLLTHYYTNVHEFEMAKYYYEKTKRFRKQNKSLVPEDNDLLDIYQNANDYEKMLKMLQKDDIKKSYFMKNATGYSYYEDLAFCYLKLNNKDSMLYYMQKMKSVDKDGLTKGWYYNNLVGDYYKLTNNADSAAIYYNKADTDKNYSNNFEARIERYANLDTLFSRNGNYQKAYHYKELWMQYKDSAAALSKDGDLVVMEIENENQRMEAETRASHNIQYMGITAAIASVFILLALLGVFSSSTTVIRGLSFFAFIFFFEFLILLFDNAIHELTHGEPWKVLSIKIVLIAMLLPFHHYVEHKVVHHLLHRKKVPFLKWRKQKPEPPAPEEKVDAVIE